MRQRARVAVIYYSSTGNVHGLAEAVARGAAGAGAEVRLRRVAELAPPEAVAANPDWRRHAEATRDVPEAVLDDLTWADALVFGSPSRYGNMAAQLKQFLDTTGGLWARNALVDKVVSGFTSAGSVHGGQETTLTSMYHVFMHWGAILVPPGYSDPVVEEAGGNPYGVSGDDRAGRGPAAATVAAAGHLGRRVTQKALLLGRPLPAPAGPAGALAGEPA
ncbi:NAD(P)H:quinone oxidoreductase [Streptomyces sp. MP131-18]|uniref:NAD(P)H:quinone oxidoreductase n=1 Tax=Streptomyces sp. MP131-18 TaxID=1857892 RepID=UPI00097BB0F0|nr:NAD(P)H:quinone oxidoreductase [Streptomyces sp. MP131-18]ONK11658.1 NAD(P)H dehydrogenase (quinone) [Streptomyces sp. MP131-18]